MQQCDGKDTNEHEPNESVRCSLGQRFPLPLSLPRPQSLLLAVALLLLFLLLLLFSLLVSNYF